MPEIQVWKMTKTLKRKPLGTRKPIKNPGSKIKHNRFVSQWFASHHSECHVSHNPLWQKKIEWRLITASGHALCFSMSWFDLGTPSSNHHEWSLWKTYPNNDLSSLWNRQTNQVTYASMGSTCEIVAKILGAPRYFPFEKMGSGARHFFDISWCDFNKKYVKKNTINQVVDASSVF